MEFTRRSSETFLLVVLAFVVGFLFSMILTALSSSSLTAEAEKRTESYRQAYMHVMTELEMMRETLKMTEIYAESLKKKKAKDSSP